MTARIEFGPSAKLVDEIQDLVYATDSSKKIRYANAAFARIFGYSSPDNLIGKPITSLYSVPAHRKLFEKSLVLAEGRVTNYMVYVRHVSGNEFVLSVDSNWIDNSQRQGIEGTGRDISTLVDLLGAFFQVRSDGIVTFCTESGASVLGFSSPVDVIGQHISIVAQVDGFWEEAFRQIDAGARAVREDVTVRLQNEGEAILRIVLGASTTQGDKPIAYQGTVDDVTESIRTHRNLEETAALNEFLMSNAMDGVYVIQDERFVLATDTLGQILGFPRDSLIGTRYLDVVGEEDRPRVKSEVEQKLSGDRPTPYEYEFTVVRGGGENRLVRVRSGQYHLAGKSAVYGYMRDVTEERHALDVLNRELREVVGRLQASLDDKELLLATIVHELGAPIAAIRGTVDSLRADSTVFFERRLDQKFDDIDLLCNLIVMLVKNVELAQVDDYAKRYGKNWIDLRHDVIDKAATLMRAAMRRNKLPTDREHVVVDLSNCPAYAHVNQELYLQVFFNLISNAVKYAAHDASAFKLHIVAELQPKWLRIHVQDNGIGVPEHETAKIFEKRVKGSNAAHVLGMGLGLWVSRNILEDYGSRIEVTSRERPTTFTVSIPRDDVVDSLPRKERQT